MRRLRIFLAALALSSCAPALAPATPTDLDYTDQTGIRVSTDPLTGCEYLVFYSHGVTPRLNEYGQPRCRRVGK